MAVGAMAVNPNTPARIAKVLDGILLVADMKNKYAVKIILGENTIEKKVNTSDECRKLIVVIADGLPYKLMIDLIKNVHVCATCGKKTSYLPDMTDHKNETHHNEFYQLYGNILPNIGHFHYALTMLRSLVKLE